MRETKSARLTRMHDEYDILRQVIPAPGLRHCISRIRSNC